MNVWRAVSQAIWKPLCVVARRAVVLPDGNSAIAPFLTVTVRRRSCTVNFVADFTWPITMPSSNSSDV